MSNRRNKNLKAVFALCVAAIAVLYGAFVVNWDLIWKGFQGEKTVKVGIDNTKVYEAKLTAKIFEIEVLDGQIRNLQSQIATLSETIAGRDLTIEEKQAEITSLNNQIKGLKQTIAIMAADALALQGEIGQLTSTNLNQSNKIEALTALINGHLLTIAGLEKTITQLQSLIAYLESTIPDITLRKEDFIATFYVGGAIWDIQVVEKDDSPVLPNTPSGNWTFVGWTIDGENMINLATVPMLQDEVFNAIIDCTVTFIVDGNNHATQTVRQDNFATEPAAPTFEGKTFGGWSVNGVAEIDVETHRIIENISFVALVRFLAGDSWATISTISKSSLASKFYSVGDRKDVEISAASDGSFVAQTLTFVILGFNHDVRAAGGLAGITFGMENLMITTRRMNAANSNVGGWEASEMRQWIQNVFVPALPADLQAVLAPVIKQTTAGNMSHELVSTTDSVFLFSETEITGETSSGVVVAEGQQYIYWRTIKNGGGGNTANTDRIKYLNNGDGAAQWWWCRSPITSGATSFTRISPTGQLNFLFANQTTGVSLGFAV